MQKHPLSYYFSHLNRDVPAGIVVFLVALPLCLGIALACGAPPLSGVISGIIGGLVVGLLSGSQLSVSGPSASFLLIVLTAIQTDGFETLLLSAVVAGAMQILLGVLRAGSVAAYFPAAVIKGMLTAIGVIVILKQIPYALGYNPDAQDDLLFLESNNFPMLRKIWLALDSFSPGVVIICVASILIMILWNSKAVKSNRLLSLAPGPLVAVIFGAAANVAISNFVPHLALSPDQLVKLPLFSTPAELFSALTFPAFGQWLNPSVYATAFSLAVVASLETLLSLEAADKLDPLKRVAPTNRELIAQGVGNIVSGLIGGLPVAAVIVRTSANVNAGAVTKVACGVHGVMLLMSVIFLPRYLNLVPLGSFAAVLLMTGYSLAKPAMFLQVYRKGVRQFAPFIVTIVSILAFDVIKGVSIGIFIGLFFVLREYYGSAFDLSRDGDSFLLKFKKDVSFINKAPLRGLLGRIDPGSNIVIDGTSVSFIDQDILEILEDFAKSSADGQISVEFRNINFATL